MNVIFLLANGTLHSHMSEIPVGRYKKAHRHSAGTHVHAVTGSGYSLLWYEGDSELRQIPWRHGVVYPPPQWMFTSISTRRPSRRAISHAAWAARAIRSSPSDAAARRRKLGPGPARRPSNRVRGSGSSHPSQVPGGIAKTASSRKWATSSTSRRFWPCARKICKA